jgi:apolipoprotein N-acyltransferase
LALDARSIRQFVNSTIHSLQWRPVSRSGNIARITVIDDKRRAELAAAAPAHMRRRAWLLAVVSGGLQVAIFPSINWYWLCWIAFLPLLVAILAARQRDAETLPATAGKGFLLAYISGLIWSAGTCYWIFHSMHVFGGLDTSTAIAVVIAFCVVLALHHGVFGLLLAVVAGRGHIRRALVLAPFLWVAVELGRTRFSGFPWDLLGTVQVDNIPLSRIATVTGVYGMSFEIILVNAAFAAAFLVPLARGRRVILAAALSAAVVLQLGVLVQAPSLPAPQTARLVQSNIPILEASGWTPQYFQQTLSELRQLSVPQPGELAGAPAPHLIVWPESPAPFYTNDPNFRHQVSEVARAANAWIVAGTLGVNPAGAPGELFNSASIISPDGAWVARYDKIHLVPFGEYVPFQSVFSFAHKLTKEVGQFQRGTERAVFPIDGQKVGVFICYESIFPDEVRQFARNGATVFINISNDGWFGRYGAPQQHLNMARMRAIENRRWLLRDTDTGITASIDPYGRVVARAPRETRTYLDAPYDVVSATTFYTRHGDWFAWGCAIITLVAVILRFRVRGA